MRLSRRSEYGLRALVDLVRHDGDGPSRSATLGEAQQPPAEVPRADHGHAQARRHRPHDAGAHGGYALAADPATMSIGRVIRLLDGALAPVPCVSLRYYEPCSCPDEATCPLRDVMIDVRDAMLEILDKETLAELAAREGRPRSTRAASTPTPWPAGARSSPTGDALVAEQAPQRGLDPLFEACRRRRRRRARRATPRAPRPASSRAPGARRRPRPRRAAPRRTRRPDRRRHPPRRPSP